MTGIYRGCALWKQDVKDFCDWYTEDLRYRNETILNTAIVKSCITCNGSRCNTIGFKVDGTSRAVNNIGTALVLNVIILLLLDLTT